MREPQQNRNAHVLVPRDVAKRVDQLTLRLGRKRAAAMLGIGTATLDAACDEGRVLVATLERLTRALESAVPSEP